MYTDQYKIAHDCLEPFFLKLGKFSLLRPINSAIGGVSVVCVCGVCVVCAWCVCVWHLYSLT